MWTCYQYALFCTANHPNSTLSFIINNDRTKHWYEILSASGQHNVFFNNHGKHSTLVEGLKCLHTRKANRILFSCVWNSTTKLIKLKLAKYACNGLNPISYNIYKSKLHLLMACGHGDVDVGQLELLDTSFIATTNCPFRGGYTSHYSYHHEEVHRIIRFPVQHLQ